MSEIINIHITDPDPIRIITVGQQGPPGATGPQGIQGIQGVKGDTGDTGLQGPPGTGAQLASETPTGAIDGSNTVFGLSQIFTGIIEVTLNGIGGESYSVIDSLTIQLAEAPLTGDILKVLYTY